MLKRIAIISSVVLVTIGIAIYSFGYFGKRDFTSLPDELPQIEDVVKNARLLKYVPYDPLMGKQGNIGSKLGFIVCSDVPNIAYGLSGYSLKSMLDKDFRNNSSVYNTTKGNVTDNPFFHRRARNLYEYFKHNGSLFPASETPVPGDLAFYHWTPTGYISHVALVTEVKGNNYMVMESAPETLWAKELSGASVIKRGWILAGFGRMYKHSPNK